MSEIRGPTRHAPPLVKILAHTSRAEQDPSHLSSGINEHVY